MSDSSKPVIRRSFMSFRVTDEEKEIIKKNAKKSNLDTSTFIRESALSLKTTKESE